MAIIGQMRISPDHFTLNFKGAAHRIDDAWEFDQETIAHGLEDPPAAALGRWLQNLVLVGFQRREGRLLVGFHQPAVADDIGCENSG